MAFESGTNARLYIEITGTDTAIADATECTVSFSAEEKTTITKDSGGGGWQSFDIGTKSMSVSGNAVYEYNSANGVDMMEIYDYWVAGADVTMRFHSGSASGTQIYSASVKLTSVEITAQADENVTFSFTANSNGAVTKTTVT